MGEMDAGISLLRAPSKTENILNFSKYILPTFSADKRHDLHFCAELLISGCLCRGWVALKHPPPDKA